MAELEEFNYECLYAHNDLRKSHSTFPLRYNKELSIEAQKYAEILAAKDKMEHSRKEDRNNAGENLAMSMRPFADFSYSGLGASVSWYSEIKDYDFTKTHPQNYPVTGHFTQLIWKDSQEAGFGRAKNLQSNNWYIVGRYQPAGNLRGKYTENVLPLPEGQKWDKVPIVEMRLEELRATEYTNARKHILDDWRAEWKLGINACGNYFDVTEIFTTPDGLEYTGENHFTEDPTKLPRPVFGIPFDDSAYEADDDDDDDLIRFDNDKKANYNHDEDIRKFIDAVVSNHNYRRKNHGVENLKLDNQLSTYAQNWANELALKDEMSFSNYIFKNGKLGENITVANNKVTENSAKELIDSWYSESQNYNYQKDPDNFKNVGHFTQIVWKNTKNVAVGVGQSLTGKSYVVCFYHPHGNLQNKFTENVLKP